MDYNSLSITELKKLIPKDKIVSSRVGKPALKADIISSILKYNKEQKELVEQKETPDKPIPTPIIMLFIWKRCDRDEEVSSIIVDTTMNNIRRKFEEYLNINREEEDYLNDDEFNKYSKDAVDLLDKMTKDDNCQAPEFNSAYIIKLYHAIF